MSKKIELANHIREFIFDIIFKHERIFYKKFKPKDLKCDLSDKIKLVTVNTFNILYVKLIKQDKKIYDIFNNFTDIMTHSEICLLKIIFDFTLQTHLSIKRKYLNTEKEELYLNNIINLLSKKLFKLFPDIKESLAHDCQIKNMKLMNPKIKYFKKIE